MDNAISDCNIYWDMYHSNKTIFFPYWKNIDG